MAGKVFVSVSLDSEQDADLVEWLNAQTNRSAAIRETLRVGLRSATGAPGVTLMDVYQELGEIRRKLDRGAVVIQSSDGTPADDSEPDDLALTLDALGVD